MKNPTTLTPTPRLHNAPVPTALPMRIPDREAIHNSIVNWHDKEAFGEWMEWQLSIKEEHNHGRLFFFINNINDIPQDLVLLIDHEDLQNHDGCPVFIGQVPVIISKRLLNAYAEYKRRIICGMQITPQLKKRINQFIDIVTVEVANDLKLPNSRPFAHAKQIREWLTVLAWHPNKKGHAKLLRDADVYPNTPALTDLEATG